jgi:hypothetical protein
MRLINSRLHGVLDYIVVAFLYAAPTLFNMDYMLEMFIYSTATLYLALAIITRFELGLIKILSFRIHGLIEVLLAVLFTSLAFWFNQQDDITGFYFYLWFAVLIMGVFVLTDFSTSDRR